MTKPMRLMLALVSSLAVTFAGINFASAETFQVGNLILEADGQFSPKKLPKKQMAPIKLAVEGHASTVDETVPPILDRLIVDFDRNGTLDTKGLPKCNPQQLINKNTEDALATCRKALVGKGETNAIVDFPDQDPFDAKGPLLAFNGGPKQLIFHVFANVPAPTAFVVPAKIQNAPGKKYGKRVVVDVPTITGGNGRLTDFEVTINRKWKDRRVAKKIKKLKRQVRKASGKKKKRIKKKIRRLKPKLKRSYIVARCPKGRFLARTRAEFRDETVVEGVIQRPCKPKRG